MTNRVPTVDDNIGESLVQGMGQGTGRVLGEAHGHGAGRLLVEEHQRGSLLAAEQTASLPPERDPEAIAPEANASPGDLHELLEGVRSLHERLSQLERRIDKLERKSRKR